jgi:hypothetical protein
LAFAVALGERLSDGSVRQFAVGEQLSDFSPPCSPWANTFGR